MANPGELFDLAVEHHRRGDLRQAEPLYREVLRAAPAHAAAHHCLGLLAYQVGHHKVASDLIRRALALNPHEADWHANLGLVLMSQGQAADAASCFRQAVRLAPSRAETYINLGNALKQQGQVQEAIDSYREALRINPFRADAHINLGNALKDRGELDAAVDCYHTALRINPKHPHAHNNLGNTLMDQGRLAEAASCYRRVLELDPTSASAHYHLGNALKDQGELKQAALCYRHALTAEPTHAGAQGHLRMIANLLRDQGHLEQATQCWRHQVAINPCDVDAHIALSDALTRSGLYSEATVHIEEALRMQTDSAPARCQRAHLRLLMGDFAGGWTDYESRWDLPDKAPRPFQKPRWEGSPLDGKTILVHAEQGLGDTIQFIRYLRFVKARGGTILLGCPPGLEGLLADVPEIDRLVTAGTPIPPYDVQVPLLSLPGIFGTTLATIPAEVPYLRANSEQVECWRKEIEHLDGFKVGIAWQGNPKNQALRHRSAPLAAFEALARVDGVQLVSMQVGSGMEQVGTAPFTITDLGRRFDPGSLMDLAAVLTQLDLTVTIDTAVAHLAGALGVEVWTLLHFSPDWRWLLERADSPWYPTMRLFRQSRLGDWGETFERVALRLKARIVKSLQPLPKKG
jgi:tetratricopeptide (TPR) repeat protein